MHHLLVNIVMESILYTPAASFEKLVDSWSTMNAGKIAHEIRLQKSASKRAKKKHKTCAKKS